MSFDQPPLTAPWADLNWGIAVHGAEHDVQVCRRVPGEDVALEPVAPENVDADRAVAAGWDAAACDSSGQIVEVGGQCAAGGRRLE
jgi:hypothetical protein